MHVGEAMEACPERPWQWSSLDSDLRPASFCCQFVIGTPAPHHTHWDHHRRTWARRPFFRPGDLGALLPRWL